MVSYTNFLIMSSPEIQENLIYNQLQSFFFEHGYESVTPGMEFWKVADTSDKCILFSVCSQQGKQTLEIHLGIRFKIVQSLVSQFLTNSEMFAENHTIKATPHRFNRPPLPRFVLTDDASLILACRQIKDFMQKKGFRFLNTFARLKRADAVINRQPLLQSSYVEDQIYRCFIGITIARLLQRTDFETLGEIYGKVLENRMVSGEITDNYRKLLNFLKYFSLN